VRITLDNPLVLGSASPRRRDLVAILGLPFVVRSASVDEAPRAGEAPPAYVERVTLAKLDAVRTMAPTDRACVLVADTIVIAPDGALLGKPRDDDEGQAMLERLSGATHEVSTHFVLASSTPDADPAHAETVTTRVTFRGLARAEIRAYVASGEGRDKAGSYAIQGKAGAFVERIEGSFTGVVGLPLSEVLVALRAIGWLQPP
jgi:septum formation protein